MIDMGKTFRKEKSFKPRQRPLNNHRDLPDYQDPEPDYPFDEDEAEEYYAKEIHSNSGPEQRRENPKAPQNN